MVTSSRVIMGKWRRKRLRLPLRARRRLAGSPRTVGICFRGVWICFRGVGWDGIEWDEDLTCEAEVA